jgi:hypothetical protein
MEIIRSQIGQGYGGYEAVAEYTYTYKASGCQQINLPINEIFFFRPFK